MFGGMSQINSTREGVDKMLKWQTTRKPIKKFSRLTIGILSLFYLYAVYSILMHTAEKTLSGNAPGDMPVIILIGVGVVVGWVARVRVSR